MKEALIAIVLGMAIGGIGNALEIGLFTLLGWGLIIVGGLSLFGVIKPNTKEGAKKNAERDAEIARSIEELQKKRAEENLRAQQAAAEQARRKAAEEQAKAEQEAKARKADIEDYLDPFKK